MNGNDVQYTAEEVKAIMDAGRTVYDALPDEDVTRICHLISSLEVDCVTKAIEKALGEAIKEGTMAGAVSTGDLLHYAGHYFIRVGFGLSVQLEVKR